MLPDSASDELNSHGFVKYRIKLISPTNIPVNSLINNTAYIFFDFNQPVVTNTASTLIYSPLGINSINKNDERLKIYPNPNNGFFNIDFEMKNAGKIRIRILNMVGEEVFEEMKVFSADEHHLEFNLSDYSTGLYMVEFTQDDKVAVKKIVIE